MIKEIEEWSEEEKEERLSFVINFLIEKVKEIEARNKHKQENILIV